MGVLVVLGITKTVQGDEILSLGICAPITLRGRVLYASPDEKTRTLQVEWISTTFRAEEKAEIMNLEFPLNEIPIWTFYGPSRNNITQLRIRIRRCRTDARGVHTLLGPAELFQ